MKTNPYGPAPSTPAAGPARRRLWHAAAAHTTGLLAFAVGLAGWYLFAQIPQLHPARGGADPARVFALLLALAAGCGLLSLVVIVHAFYLRRFARLLYVLPPATFVVWLTIAFFKMRA